MLCLFVNRKSRFLCCLVMTRITIILYSLMVWVSGVFSGERLISLEASLVQCFAFYKTLSKTSGGNFLLKHLFTRFLHDVFGLVSRVFCRLNTVVMLAAEAKKV